LVSDFFELSTMVVATSNAYWMVSVNHCIFRDHFREPPL
jgi:hypothetical protein